jgi:hypothetical protein
MNASHILSRWRRVRGVLRRSSVWFTALTIAEAGTRGIRRTDLAELTGLENASLTHSIGLMRSAGLVVQEQGQRRAGQTGACPMIAKITPKGLEFLGLKPMPEPQTQEVPA